MRKKPTRKRPYFKMESAMTAILRDASGKMHHGILFDPPLRDDQDDDLSTISPIEGTKPKYMLKHTRSFSLIIKSCINTSGYGLPVIILNALSYFVAIHMHALSNFFSSSFFEVLARLFCLRPLP